MPTGCVRGSSPTHGTQPVGLICLLEYPMLRSASVFASQRLISLAVAAAPAPQTVHAQAPKGPVSFINDVARS
jgi:hypothetical protein